MAKRSKTFEFEYLYKKISIFFSGIPDHRANNKSIQLSDVLKSAFAMFSQKTGSLLQFEQRKEATDKNLKHIYNIERIPSDSAMRTILDELDPALVRPLFLELHKGLVRNGVWRSYRYLPQGVLVAIDGTSYYHSKKCHCSKCLHTTHRNGETSYHHKMVVGTLVHPEKREVFVLDAEPIENTDGHSKQDSEQVASKRLYESLANYAEKQTKIIVGDALFATGPQIREVWSHQDHFIFVVKPKSHSTLFKQIAGREERGQLKEHTIVKDGIIHHFVYTNDVLLNDSSADVRVNFLEYYELIEETGEVKYHNTWVSDIKLTAHNVYKVMRGGRARWKIENETFNTLKNQQYNIEHNYGHGKNHLAFIFALLMLLAFLVDQIQQYGSVVFQEALAACQSYKSLWTKMRELFNTKLCASLCQIWLALTHGYKLEALEVKWDTS